MILCHGIMITIATLSGEKGKTHTKVCLEMSQVCFSLMDGFKQWFVLQFLPQQCKYRDEHAGASIIAVLVEHQPSQLRVWPKNVMLFHSIHKLL